MLLKIIVLVFIIISLCICTAWKNKIRYYKLILIILSTVYILTVAWFTIIGRESLNTEYSLLPFESYIKILSVRWHGWGEYVFGAIVGNVLLFVPLGLIIGNISKIRHNYLISGIVGFIISLCIEITQYYFAIGTFEADDLMNNIWGAVIGCSVSVVLILKNRTPCKIIVTLIPVIAFVIVIMAFCAVPIAKEIYRIYI